MTGLDGSDRFLIDIASFGVKGYTSLTKGPTVKLTISDFETGIDTIQFDGISNKGFDDLVLRDSSGHAVVQVGRFRVHLLGVQSAELAPEDFVFV